MRVLNRTVTQDSELTYRIRVELSPTGVVPTRVGTIIGGYLCTDAGYHVPVDAGDLGPMVSYDCTRSWFDSPANGGSEPNNYGRVLLYDTATYAYVYHCDHGATNCTASMRITPVAGGSLFGNQPMGSACPCGPGGPMVNDASGSFTTTGTPGSSQYYELTVQHTNYSGCSATGVHGTANLAYVSGADPRFSGLIGCPF